MECSVDERDFVICRSSVHEQLVRAHYLTPTFSWAPTCPSPHGKAYSTCPPPARQYENLVCYSSSCCRKGVVGESLER